MSTTIDSQYSIVKGDFDISNNVMKLTEDINNFIVSPKLRGGYGSGIQSMDKTSESCKSDIIKLLSNYIRKLNNVKTVSVNCEEVIDGSSREYRFMTNIVCYISNTEEEEVSIPITVKVK